MKENDEDDHLGLAGTWACLEIASLRRLIVEYSSCCYLIRFVLVVFDLLGELDRFLLKLGVVVVGLLIDYAIMYELETNCFDGLELRFTEVCRGLLLCLSRLDTLLDVPLPLELCSNGLFV